MKYKIKTMPVSILTMDLDGELNISFMRLANTVLVLGM